LSPDARSASGDNTRKTVANAAGVSPHKSDEIAIVQAIRHYLNGKTYMLRFASFKLVPKFWTL